jgi:HTH-type transcriptional regulator/antitoxin HipB
MLKTSKQHTIARQRLEDAKRAFEYYATNKSSMSDEDWQIQIALLGGQIEELSVEISEFDQLIRGELDILEQHDIFQISDVISKARLAKGWTQKMLADELGIDEQQIQRYEANDFESAKLSRILEIIYAMDLELKFEPIFLGSKAEYKPDFLFDLNGYDNEEIEMRQEIIKRDKTILPLR